mmetsp:Transcript_44522/g.43176  ORF Transcript_44522/g.43176 Transcript_44522/m.43176 type:complete len:249 (-) Transcript_44522:632-1378(-)
MEHEFLLEVLQELHTPLDIHKERVHLPYVLHFHLGGFPLLGHQVRGGNQVDSISECGFSANPGEELHGIFRDLDVLFLAPDVQDLLDFLLIVGLSGDDEGPIQKVQREPMGTFVVSPSDLGDSSVGGHDHDGSLVTLEGSVQEGKALYVQHVDLIHKQHSWHNVSPPFLTPLRYLLVDLLPHFWLDLPNVSCEQSQKPLSPTVDHIDLMQSHCVHHFLPFLQFSLWALHEPSLGSHVVKVTAPAEGST